MEEGTTKLEVSAREWLVGLVTGVLVFLVAIEAEQGPIAMVAAALALLAVFGLLWRLLALR